MVAALEKNNVGHERVNLQGRGSRQIAILSRVIREVLAEELWLKEEWEEGSFALSLPGRESSRQSGLLERYLCSFWEGLKEGK